MPRVDFEPTLTHYQLLYSADGADLSELRAALRGPEYEWAAIPLHKAKKALRQLIDAAFVEIYAEVGEPLPKGDALAAIETAGAWDWETRPRGESVEVYLTDAGFTAFKALKPKFGEIGLVDTEK